MQRLQPIIFPGIPSLAHEQIYLKTNYGSKNFKAEDFLFMILGALLTDGNYFEMSVISAPFRVKRISINHGKVSTTPTLRPKIKKAGPWLILPYVFLWHRAIRRTSEAIRPNTPEPRSQTGPDTRIGLALP
jgi:hypothetical protein